MSQKETILVTGAGGHLGQLVLNALLERPGRRLIATTRDPQKLGAFARRGVEVRAADFADPSSLDQAFAGADRALLISTDALGQRIAQHGHAIQAMVRAGVKHVVYTSWLNPDRSPAAVAPDHVATERLIEASGLGYTILRNNFYADNLLASVPQWLKGGVVAGAQGGGRISYVTREDCARAAAGALTDHASYNRVLDVTGPAALGLEDLALIMSELSGRPIKAVDLAPAEYQKALAGAGLPGPVAELIVSFDLAAKQGSASGTSTAVRDLTGHEPTSLKQFLRAHVGARAA